MASKDIYLHTSDSRYMNMDNQAEKKEIKSTIYNEYITDPNNEEREETSVEMKELNRVNDRLIDDQSGNVYEYITPDQTEVYQSMNR